MRIKLLGTTSQVFVRKLAATNVTWKKDWLVWMLSFHMLDKSLFPVLDKSLAFVAIDM